MKHSRKHKRGRGRKTRGGQCSAMQGGEQEGENGWEEGEAEEEKEGEKGEQQQGGRRHTRRHGRRHGKSHKHRGKSHKGRSDWNRKVMEVYHRMKRANKDVRLKDAMREASRLKKKGQL